MLEPLQNPVAYFFAMVVVFSVASLPSSPPTLMAAKANPPWLIATLGATAAGLAALFDHHAVRRAFRTRTLDRVRRHPLFERAERWAKVAPFLTVAVFAATPLPFWIPRVLVPLSGYPLRRYALAVAVGRWPRVFVIAAFGKLVDVPAWLLDAAVVGAITAGAAGALYRRLRTPRSPVPSPVTMGGPERSPQTPPVAMGRPERSPQTPPIGAGGAARDEGAPAGEGGGDPAP